MDNLENSFGVKSKDKKKKDSNTIKNVGIAASQIETIKRFGSAAKEHLVAYEGIDRETGQVLKKGLKSISESKVNPLNQDSNIRQQAGFSAEVKTVARENAEKIISGDTTRSVRTDDMTKQVTADGKNVGGVNDQLFDVASVDKNGKYIDGSGRQLKYVGKDAKDCCNKLLDSKYDKYRDADAQIEIKKDLYDDVQNELSKRIDSLDKQIQHAEKNGDYSTVEKLRKQLDRAEKTKANLKKGALTDKEAIEARLHPKISTAKDIAEVSHRAGLDGAKGGAIIGGSISLVKNVVSVIKGDEEPDEACAHIIVDVGASAASGYAIGFMGTGIKGILQNSSSNLLRQVSNSALPAAVAVGILEAGKTLYRFADGQIDAEECFVELGKKGVGIAASTVGATVGQAIIPIPVVGGVIGGMVGYAISSECLKAIENFLKEPSSSEVRRMAEAEYAKVKTEMERYRSEIERISRAYFADHIKTFDTALNAIRDSLVNGDSDGAIFGANMITEKLGGTVQYRNMKEFNAVFDDENSCFVL